MSVAVLERAWACDASVHHATRYGGANFVLVGDAASFIEPLSSFGVKKVTSDTGAYRFPVLPPGTHELDYSLSGFTTLKHTGIVVAVGSVLDLNVTLKVGTLSEAITVTGDTPVVSASSAQVSATYNRDWV